MKEGDKEGGREGEKKGGREGGRQERAGKGRKGNKIPQIWKRLCCKIFV